jgi:hypothetical protein
LLLLQAQKPSVLWRKTENRSQGCEKTWSSKPLDLGVTLCSTTILSCEYDGEWAYKWWYHMAESCSIMLMKEINIDKWMIGNKQGNDRTMANDVPRSPKLCFP